MIFDLRRDTPNWREVADVCVVGAGAAGLCLAKELCNQGKVVLLLDGGGLTVEQDAQEPYKSESVGNLHHGIHQGRFRVLGGTTSRWAGQIAELDDEDFMHKEWIPGSGWPFPKSALASFYSKALHSEGLSTCIPDDTSVWGELGTDVPQFTNVTLTLSRWCTEPDFKRLYAKELYNNGCLKVWLHTNAVNIELREDTVTAVCCRTQTGQTASFRARSFVFCMGAIESSRFFLQARGAESRWNRSRRIGYHFQDHLSVETARIYPQDCRHFANLFDNIWIRRHKYAPKLRLAHSTQSRDKLLNCGAMPLYYGIEHELMTAVRRTAKDLLRNHINGLPLFDASLVALNVPLISKHLYRLIKDKRSYNDPTNIVRLRVYCEQQPTGPSRVSLSDQRDSLGLFRSRLDWRISDIELTTIRAMTLAVQRSVGNFATLVPDKGIFEDQELLRSRIQDSFHHMGGMKMSVSASTGAVTSDLLLHGTNNCFVCSAAVFPCSGFSNPTHTLIALALRLAAKLTSTL